MPRLKDQDIPIGEMAGGPRSRTATRKRTYGWEELMSAGFKQENLSTNIPDIIDGWIASAYADEPDPNFDPFLNTEGTPAETNPEILVGVTSLADREKRFQQFHAEKRRREILSTPGGLAAGMIGGALSWENLIPISGALMAGRAVLRASRVATIAASARNAAYAVGTEAVVSAGIAEVGLHDQQMLRTKAETVMNVGAAAVLGSVLGGAVGAFSSPRLSHAIQLLSNQLDGISILGKHASVADRVRAESDAMLADKEALKHGLGNPAQMAEEIPILRHLQRRYEAQGDVKGAAHARFLRKQRELSLQYQRHIDGDESVTVETVRNEEEIVNALIEAEQVRNPESSQIADLIDWFADIVRHRLELEAEPRTSADSNLLDELALVERALLVLDRGIDPESVAGGARAVEQFSDIGPGLAARFQRAGIHTAEDLIRALPDLITGKIRLAGRRVPKRIYKAIQRQLIKGPEAPEPTGAPKTSPNGMDPDAVNPSGARSIALRNQVALTEEAGDSYGFKIVRNETGALRAGTDDQVVPASTNRRTKEIHLDMPRLKTIFDQKAWQYPQTPGVKALPENTFETFDEFVEFTIGHEVAHLRTPREDFLRNNPKSTLGEYENFINEEALNMHSRNQEANPRPDIDEVNKRLRAILGVAEREVTEPTTAGPSRAEVVQDLEVEFERVTLYLEESTDGATARAELDELGSGPYDRNDYFEAIGLIQSKYGGEIARQAEGYIDAREALRIAQDAGVPDNLVPAPLTRRTPATAEQAAAPSKVEDGGTETGITLREVERAEQGDSSHEILLDGKVVGHLTFSRDPFGWGWNEVEHVALDKKVQGRSLAVDVYLELSKRVGQIGPSHGGQTPPGARLWEKIYADPRFRKVREHPWGEKRGGWIVEARKSAGAAPTARAEAQAAAPKPGEVTLGRRFWDSSNVTKRERARVDTLRSDVDALIGQRIRVQIEEMRSNNPTRPPDSAEEWGTYLREQHEASRAENAPKLKRSEIEEMGKAAAAYERAVYDIGQADREGGRLADLQEQKLVGTLPAEVREEPPLLLPEGEREVPVLSARQYGKLYNELLAEKQRAAGVSLEARDPIVVTNTEIEARIREKVDAGELRLASEDAVLTPEGDYKAQNLRDLRDHLRAEAAHLFHAAAGAPHRTVKDALKAVKSVSTEPGDGIVQGRLVFSQKYGYGTIVSHSIRTGSTHVRWHLTPISTGQRAAEHARRTEDAIKDVKAAGTEARRQWELDNPEQKFRRNENDTARHLIARRIAARKKYKARVKAREDQKIRIIETVGLPRDAKDWAKGRTTEEMVRGGLLWEARPDQRRFDFTSRVTVVPRNDLRITLDTDGQPVTFKEPTFWRSEDPTPPMDYRSFSKGMAPVDKQGRRTGPGGLTEQEFRDIKFKPTDAESSAAIRGADESWYRARESEPWPRTENGVRIDHATIMRAFASERAALAGIVRRAHQARLNGDFVAENALLKERFDIERSLEQRGVRVEYWTKKKRSGEVVASSTLTKRFPANVDARLEVIRGKINKLERDKAAALATGRKLAPDRPTVESGGAAGADTVWDEMATAAGWNVNAHSFEGHKTSSKNRVLYSKTELALADKHAEKANKTLKRRWPFDKGSDLVRRNYFQIKDVDQVVAIAPMEKGKDGKLTGNVSGGTGWAVQMAIDIGGKEIHVFDYRASQWYSWDGKAFVPSKAPSLKDNFAGIGSRGEQKKGGKYWEKILPDNAKEEIRRLFVGRELAPDTGTKAFEMEEFFPAKSTSKLLDELRTGKRPEERKLKKKPVLSALKAMGGVDPKSPLAAQLRSMDVTSKTMPGLFKKGGRKNLDEFDLADDPHLWEIPPNLRDTYGRPEDNAVLEAIDAERRGTPRRTAEEHERITEAAIPRQELEQELDRLTAEDISQREYAYDLAVNMGDADPAKVAAPRRASVQDLLDNNSNEQLIEMLRDSPGWEKEIEASQQSSNYTGVAETVDAQIKRLKDEEASTVEGIQEVHRAVAADAVNVKVVPLDEHYAHADVDVELQKVKGKKGGTRVQRPGLLSRVHGDDERPDIMKSRATQFDPELAAYDLINRLSTGEEIEGLTRETLLGALNLASGTIIKPDRAALAAHIAALQARIKKIGEFDTWLRHNNVDPATGQWSLAQAAHLARRIAILEHRAAQTEKVIELRGAKFLEEAQHAGVLKGTGIQADEQLFSYWERLSVADQELHTRLRVLLRTLPSEDDVTAGSKWRPEENQSSYENLFKQEEFQATKAEAEDTSERTDWAQRPIDDELPFGELRRTIKERWERGERFRDLVPGTIDESGNIWVRSQADTTAMEEEIVSALGTEKVLLRISPAGRMALSPIISSRRAVQLMSDTSLRYVKNKYGIPTLPSAEMGTFKWMAKLALVTEGNAQVWAAYRMGKETATRRDVARELFHDFYAANWRNARPVEKLSHRAFMEEVGHQLTREGNHEIPEVQALVKKYREGLFKPAYEQAFKLGLVREMTEQEVSTYLPRLYLQEKIKDDPAAFLRDLEAALLKKNPDIKPEELKDAAQAGMRKILGESGGRITYEPFTYREAKSLRTRELNYDSIEMENWLEWDVDLLARFYARTVGADVSIAQRFRKLKERWVRNAKGERVLDEHGAGEYTAPFKELQRHIGDLEGRLGETETLLTRTKMELEKATGDEAASLKSQATKLEGDVGTLKSQLDLSTRTMNGHVSMVELGTLNVDDVKTRAIFETTEPDIQLKWARKEMTEEVEARKEKGVSEVEARNLDRKLEADLTDLEGQAAIMRGTAAAPADPNALLPRIAYMIRRINYMTMGGAFVVSAFVDPARIVMTQGLARTLKHGVVPFVNGLSDPRLRGALQANRLELKKAGIGLDITINGRATSLYDLGGDWGRHTKFEKFVRRASDNFAILSLLAPWNAAMKQWAGTVVAQTILEMTERVAKGTGTNDDVVRLAALRISPEMATRIWNDASVHTTPVDAGGYNFRPIENTEAWDPEALEAFLTAIRTDTDKTIITPGSGDIPLAITGRGLPHLEKSVRRAFTGEEDPPVTISPELMRVMAQFKRFAIASTTRTLVAGLQARDKATFNGAALALGLGIMVHNLKAALHDYPAGDWRDQIKRGVDRSGLWGITSDINNALSVGTHGEFALGNTLGGRNTDKWSNRTLVDMVGGPAVQQVKRSAQVMQMGGKLLFLQPDQITEKEVRALRRTMWMNDVPYWDFLFDAVENGLNSAVRMSR